VPRETHAASDRKQNRTAGRKAAGSYGPKSDLLAKPTEPGLFYNVNLPHLGPADDDPKVVFCPLDPHPLPLCQER